MGLSAHAMVCGEWTMGNHSRVNVYGVKCPCYGMWGMDNG